MGNFSPRFFETNEEYIAPLFKPSLLGQNLWVIFLPDFLRLMKNSSFVQNVTLGEMDDGEMFSLHFCSLFELHLDILYVKNKIII